MKKAIITGPTGTIGIALIRLLAERGIEVLAVCHKGSARIGNIPAVRNVQIIECDLGELINLPGLIGEHDWDIFFHLGWECTVGASRDEVKFQIKNIEYTIQAVETANEMGCKRFVGVGSQAEYGRYEEKLDASTPVNPENGYGMAKLCAGQMSGLRCRQLGMEHIWTRVLSVYGPYDGENTMVISGIRKMLRGECPEFSPCEQLWDYLYCEDAARALYLAAVRGKNGSVYPIGSGQARPLKDYVEMMRVAVEHAIGCDVRAGIGRLPYRPRQVMYLCADISQLTEDTGFLPEISFDKGIAKTVQWCMNM